MKKFMSKFRWKGEISKTDSRRRIKPNKLKTIKEIKSHLIPKESDPNNFRDDFHQTKKNE